MEEQEQTGEDASQVQIFLLFDIEAGSTSKLIFWTLLY